MAIHESRFDQKFFQLREYRTYEQRTNHYPAIERLKKGLHILISTYVAYTIKLNIHMQHGNLLLLLRPSDVRPKYIHIYIFTCVRIIAFFIFLSYQAAHFSISMAYSIQSIMTVLRK